LPNLESLDYCTRERDGAILTVTLARPERDNALPAAASRELAGVFDAFAADPSLHVAILTGAGDVFCAGVEPENGAAHPATGFGGVTGRLDLTKPLIAAVNGDAAAEGFELALACDLVVAVEDARFVFDHLRRGRMSRDGGIHRLVRELPMKRAMAILLAGDPISAPEGVALGFVNDLCARGDAAAVARQWAHRLLENGIAGLQATKHAALHGLAQGSLHAALTARYDGLERFAAEHRR
jgi:enoyl-CoA hydratase/carnithine racemase